MAGNRRIAPVGRNATPQLPPDKEGKGAVSDGGSLFIRVVTTRMRGVRFYPKRRQKENAPRGGVFLLVDLRGIEPLSENRRYDFLRGQSLY